MDIVEIAEQEIETFDRPAAQTSLLLIDEIKTLRAKLAAMESQSSVGAVISDKISIAAALNANGYTRLKVGDKLYAKPVPADKPMFQSACSGMWYENPLSCGEVAAVKIDGREYRLPTEKSAAAPDHIAPLIKKVREWGVEHTGCEPSVSCWLLFLPCRHAKASFIYYRGRKNEDCYEFY